ncbi:tyrosine-type recombinase/integrase [Erysipelothrix rhusiopathiae]|nr:tyrosine-type recombinase/integrase [Erysipelothrix rhusiopathiae]MDE8086105.1 tyrosine-type recombinase/integrase [Erysipelothrix rhusiopathiae]MDE8089629.1 tyrosine-type recombinase/integrase [Erysipelothrix rhusiopathiae]MDE8096210.1 tyrosine-type recombinase/integrase [Erysipelothrix rhusiopathiae]MDE8101380.1 tyrosine-type recombinase/integrase [Erysipelothrix rhusiopathiae]
MPKKAKNLNPNSKRAFLQNQLEAIQKELEEIPTLYRSDLEKYYLEYPKSLHEHEFSESTKKVYLRGARRLIDRYTSDDSYLTKDDLIYFKQDLLDEYEKVSTINSYITSVNRFLYYCDVGIFRVSKVTGQTENVLQHRIYKHEYKRMYNKAKANGEMELHYIIKLMGSTGIRVDELKSFTSKSIQNKYVSVDNKGRIRKVPLPGTLARELRKYCKRNKLDGPLFTLTYDQIYNGLKRVAGQCKINKSKIHPHAFRHYFGFNFVDRAGDIKIAQLSDILGHSSIETTRIYTRGTIEDYQKMLDNVK